MRPGLVRAPRPIGRSNHNPQPTPGACRARDPAFLRKSGETMPQGWKFHCDFGSPPSSLSGASVISRRSSQTDGCGHSSTFCGVLLVGRLQTARQPVPGRASALSIKKSPITNGSRPWRDLPHPERHGDHSANRPTRFFPVQHLDDLCGPAIAARDFRWDVFRRATSHASEEHASAHVSEAQKKAR